MELDPNSANQMAQIELRNKISILETNVAALAGELGKLSKGLIERKEVDAQTANAIAKLNEKLEKLAKPVVQPEVKENWLKKLLRIK